MFRHLLAAWGSQHRLPTRPARRLRLESLEGREVPTVTVAAIPDQPVTNNVPEFLPVTVTNTPNGAVSYSVTSNNAAVVPSVVQGGRSVKFTVTGKNADGTTFTGDIVIRLFESEAPLATGRIIQLVQQGYYTGKLFHRVSGGFTGSTDTIIQGGSANGDGTGGSGLGTLPDEFNADYRFNSPGVVASANAGDDTTDQQFFIVRPTTALANRPQFLNFNYTVLGILTAGADVYEKINATPLNGSTPVSNVTITAATVFADPNNAVLKITTQAGFTGTARLTVTPSDSDGASPAVTANLTGTAANPPNGNPPFLGTLPTNLTTAAGQPVTFSVPYTDVDGSPVTIAVRDGSFAGAPTNVTVSINQTAGTVTLTPVAGFSGTVSLKVGVRDGTDRSGTGTLDTASNFDTQALSLTVTPAASVPQATVTLSANPATATTGQAVTLTAGVTATGVSNPAGTVEFRNGNTLLATAVVSNGVATTTQGFTTAGTQSLTATFVPSDSTVVTGASSPTVSLTVTGATPATSTTTLTAPSTATTGVAVSLSATVVASDGSNPAGTVQFSSNGSVIASAVITGGTATASATFSAAGSQSVTATFVPTSSTAVTGSASAASTVTVSAATTTQPPLSSGITAVGSRAGSEPRVTVYNADGSTRVSFLAFEASFTGGVRTAVADVTGDGVPEIVVVPAYGGGPLIKLFDPTTGEQTGFKQVFEDSFRGGLTLATGDTGSLGYSRVLVGAGETGSPRVLLYDFKLGQTILDYYAYDSSLRGGVSVAMGVLPGGTGADIITGVGAGGGPQVNVYNGAGTLLGSTQQGDTTDRSGIGVRYGKNPDGSGNALFVNRRTADGGASEVAIDTSFVNSSAGSTSSIQQSAQNILNGVSASS